MGHRLYTRQARESLTELANNVVSSFWSTLEAARNNKILLLEHLAELVATWQKWQGIVETVDSLASYLNRYYVRHHSLLSVTRILLFYWVPL